MRYPCKLTLTVLLALASGAALAQAGLSYERAAGLGLKPQTGGAALPAGLVSGGQAMQVWQTTRASDHALYGGAREAPRLGLHAAESYGGIVYSLPGGWGSSLEAGFAQESPLAPRSFALTGQLHTAFAGGGLSVGLKYRVYGADTGARYGAPGEALPTNGYTLAPP
ncbi:MAG: hypothetical protein ACREB3_10190, partial [Burkholderiales bacterium]